MLDPSALDGASLLEARVADAYSKVDGERRAHLDRELHVFSRCSFCSRKIADKGHAPSGICASKRCRARARRG
jgi:hypothetical protein